METINIYEWFLKTNVDGFLNSPVLESILEVTMVISLTDYSELKLSNYQYINGKEIRFETHNIRKFLNKYHVSVSVYIDNYLVYFNKKREDFNFLFK